MINLKKFLIGFSAVFLAACVEIDGTSQKNYSQTEPDGDAYPSCQQETMVVVYDDAGAYQVPGCMDYIPQIYGYAESSAELAQLNEQEEKLEEQTLIENNGKIEDKDKTKDDDEDEEISAADIEGEFPDVLNNKYYPNQVVMQNLQTRVLAYCRGNNEQIAECIERLECAGYTQLRNVPTMSSKYDALKAGSFPTRRWRNGETVPRW